MNDLAQKFIYIPTHLVQHFVVDPSSNRISSSHILSNATAHELYEIIGAFKPNLTINSPEKDDYFFLKNVFVEMVAPSIENLHIPDSKSAPYLQASFRNAICLPEDSPTTLTYEDKIDGERDVSFRIMLLSSLREGRYYDAGANLEVFLREYNYLTTKEISHFKSAIEVLDERAQDCLHEVERGHRDIELIKIRLRQPDVSPSDREKYEAQLAGAKSTLELYQNNLNQTVGKIGFLEATVDHLDELCRKHELPHPIASTSG